MKFILNRFLTVFAFIPIMIALILLSYVSLYFIIHWVIFGRSVKDDWYKLSDYLQNKFPRWDE